MNFFLSQKDYSNTLLQRYWSFLYDKYLLKYFKKRILEFYIFWGKYPKKVKFKKKFLAKVKVIKIRFFQVIIWVPTIRSFKTITNKLKNGFEESRFWGSKPPKMSKFTNYFFKITQIMKIRFCRGLEHNHRPYIAAEIK